MTDAVVLTHSRTFPAEPERAFDWLIAVPPQDVFDRRFMAIAPITDSSFDGAEPWGSVGDERLISMSDGTSMRERLTVVDRPRSFEYEITGFTGPLRALIERAEGTWTVAPAGTGARLTWQWRVHPTSSVAAAVAPVLRWLWQGYARLAFERIESGLVA